MRDENTGRKVLCPFCNSPRDCGHLLALIDKSFNECSGGYAYERYHEFWTLIEAAFLRSFREEDRKQRLEPKDELSELWQYAREGYSPGDEEVTLDQYVLTRLIIGQLEAAGGLRYSGSIASDGAPGYCSAWVLFHAQNPQAVFEAALANLNFRLERECPAQ